MEYRLAMRKLFGFVGENKYQETSSAQTPPPPTSNTNKGQGEEKGERREMGKRG